MPLRAGPVSLVFSDGDLRDLRVGDDEIVRRVYMVFQDLNWTARPWLLDDVAARVEDDAFDISFTATGTFDATGFTWTGRVSGDPRGTITYSVEGLASTAFLRNRLGLSVLHPMALAGADCVVEHVDGSRQKGRFPEQISPHQPFLDVRSITHHFGHRGRAKVTMLGGAFEMEDHRNWSDASFKTYTPPLSLPFPVEVAAGATVAQSVIIGVDADVRTSTRTPDVEAALVRVIVDKTVPTVRLPRFGLQVATDGAELTGRQEDLLRELSLHHLRVDVDLSHPGALGILASAVDQARAVGARLVAALHAPDVRQLAAAADLLTAEQGAIDCCLVFDPAQKVSGPSLARAARASFGPDMRIGGGTDLYFAELNREPPDTTALDVVSFSLSPQVHASDDLTVMQNLAAQSVIAVDARRLAGTAQVYVGPVTLRPRFNPNATRPDLDVSSTPLPSAVDARQPTGFAAAWTIGCVAQLATAGTVSAVTFFETTGWRGVMERDGGSPQPDDFPSRPGAPFPVYHALALFAGFTRARLCRSTDPERVTAVTVEDGARRRVVVANLTASPVEVGVGEARTGEALVHLDPYAHDFIDYPRAAR